MVVEVMMKMEMYVVMCRVKGMVHCGGWKARENESLAQIARHWLLQCYTCNNATIATKCYNAIVATMLQLLQLLQCYNATRHSCHNATVATMLQPKI